MSKAIGNNVVSKAEYARILVRNGLLTTLGIACPVVANFFLAPMLKWDWNIPRLATLCVVLGIWLLSTMCGTFALSKVINIQKSSLIQGR